MEPKFTDDVWLCQPSTITINTKNTKFMMMLVVFPSTTTINMKENKHQIHDEVGCVALNHNYQREKH